MVLTGSVFRVTLPDEWSGSLSVFRPDDGGMLGESWLDLSASSGETAIVESVSDLTAGGLSNVLRVIIIEVTFLTNPSNLAAFSASLALTSGTLFGGRQELVEDRRLCD